MSDTTITQAVNNMCESLSTARELMETAGSPIHASICGFSGKISIHLRSLEELAAIPGTAEIERIGILELIEQPCTAKTWRVSKQVDDNTEAFCVIQECQRV